MGVIKEWVEGDAPQDSHHRHPFIPLDLLEERDELVRELARRAETDKVDPKVVGPRVVGGLYFCGYWHREYTVTAIEYKDDWRGTCITVRWEDDGHTTTHCTAWDEKWDRVITGEKAETEV